VGHQGPLLWCDKDYNGSRFNVLVEWENGEITTEPLSVIAANDPVTCAVYAREHDLLDVEGWKRFRNLAKHEKHFLRLVKQAKMKSYRQSSKYKFRCRIPKDYEEALKLDELNQNTKWKDATITDDKICMMTTRLACNQAIESSYWRMENNSDVGLLMGYVLYRLPVELEFMDLDTFPR
jgi:hypothetical protein